MIKRALKDSLKDFGTDLSKQVYQNDGVACLIFTNKDKLKSAVVNLNFQTL